MGISYNRKTPSVGVNDSYKYGLCPDAPSRPMSDGWSVASRSAVSDCQFGLV